ncbi:MAG: hypothetical protein PUJ51_25340 [Clostridiales bacterium]|uniref:hypothetical protein n=1 Tax=Terrisporobacter sp. TaxID=1965305 RepID=UPI002A4F3ADA|nr:hypothetical protein [Terrisporobacter sp.]MDD7757784.1 hypothetical protein [Clostridiales bacterium]MDY4135177.1 hypothetical protein [Terrisporobacter sp.]
MNKENDIVYVKTKNGIFKCYKSEQMHKPIYYPIESKTNGYIDYNDVIRILNIDDLYEQVKKQKEVIDKANKKLNNFIDCCKAEKLESCSDYIHHQYWDMFERFNKQIKDVLKEAK